MRPCRFQCLSRARRLVAYFRRYRVEDASLAGISFVVCVCIKIKKDRTDDYVYELAAVKHTEERSL